MSTGPFFNTTELNVIIIIYTSFYPTNPCIITRVLTILIEYLSYLSMPPALFRRFYWGPKNRSHYSSHGKWLCPFWPSLGMLQSRSSVSVHYIPFWLLVFTINWRDPIPQSSTLSIRVRSVRESFKSTRGSEVGKSTPQLPTQTSELKLLRGSSTLNTH